MKGQLYLYHVDKDPPDKDINLLAIVTNRIAPGWVSVPQLSPSEKLIKKREQWLWERKWPRKWPDFVKQYREELKQPLKETYIKHLLKRLNEGNNIAFACYCADEKHCHKQIIGEWVSDRGIAVVQGKDERRQRKELLYQRENNNIKQLTIETVAKDGEQ
ncbi:DUF488 family protein [Novibacillus thermophilus]|uniref:DUF488 domain-containing protein n=1 Tax=Novibacillus thermophilus TaxID=1471761 RepID=A0A1U9K6L5_9BACL|nr:DUF488 family protein [Novibacillus thermophilus]AQS55671.1 hypothetical protein B0W44_07600 [Novibacillus thermophilus]